jgi:hypothetical protein
MGDYPRNRRAGALERARARDLSPGDRDTRGSGPFDHPVPQVPLVLDGELLEDPGRVRELESTPLYYTPLRHAAGVALGAYTEREAMLAASREAPEVLAGLELTDARSVCTTNPDSLGEFAFYFEHMHFGGDSISDQPGWGFASLVIGDWNDTISSVDWCRWDVSLFQHSNFEGDELFLRAGCDTPYLEAFRWNDTASSTVNWGTRR